MLSECKEREYIVNYLYHGNDNPPINIIKSYRIKSIEFNVTRYDVFYLNRAYHNYPGDNLYNIIIQHNVRAISYIPNNHVHFCTYTTVRTLSYEQYLSNTIVHALQYVPNNFANV